ncbi:MAG: sulfotransferase domain-containing protein [Gammaproteobacteria bacterium]|nr:sulfotransferase domain-containing protein [Gammaproteobacteria bacterium]
MSTAARRARSIEELRERQSAFVSEEGMARALAFRPRPTDVIISTFPKSGTTWLQQIVHSLRTRGSMDFEEITAVVPWIELAHDMGLDVDAEQVANPRAYKSHLAWDDVPKGGRYICAFRDCGDVLVSMYRFFEGWFFERGSITLETFAREHFLARQGLRRYWPHLVSWWRQRARDDVLLLCYENMTREPPAAIERVARFIGIELDAELRDIVLAQSSIEFMQAHRHQFDDNLVRKTRDAACGLPAGGEVTGKVRSGRVGARERELSPDILHELDRLWRVEVEPATGLASYAALCERLRDPAD